MAIRLWSDCGDWGLRLPQTEYRWSLPANALAKWYMRREQFRASMTHDIDISLINPAANLDPAIRVIEMDCMDFDESLVGQFDVIRASNIISPRYGFCDEKLQTVLGHIHAYLRTGGCLAISRNDNLTEVERGSTWKSQSNGFTHVDDFGGGSEIKDVLAEFRAFSPSQEQPASSMR